jgi:hypothetical protein
VKINFGAFGIEPMVGGGRALPLDCVEIRETGPWEDLESRLSIHFSSNPWSIMLYYHIIEQNDCTLICIPFLLTQGFKSISLKNSLEMRFCWLSSPTCIIHRISWL